MSGLPKNRSKDPKNNGGERVAGLTRFIARDHGSEKERKKENDRCRKIKAKRNSCWDFILVLISGLRKTENPRDLAKQSLRNGLCGIKNPRDVANFLVKKIQ